jgi:hypothetical protein
MRVLKQSTTPTIVFLLVDSTSHISGKTGVTPTVKLSKNGAAGASATNTATAIDATNNPGWYALTLTTTETDTIGDLILSVTATGADPTDRLLCIETADLTDIDSEIDAIKAKTDQLIFVGSKVDANAAVSLTAQNIQDIADGVIAQLPGAGGGNTSVNHNTGGTDNLRYMYRGSGIDNATITAYLKADYSAGNTGSSAVRGSSTTGPDGRWLTPMFLDAGYTYVIVFYVQGQYGLTVAEIII